MKAAHETMKFVNLLRAKKLRVTPIRQAILHVLAQSSQPLSVEDICSAVKKRNRNDSFDLATLYRNMKSFEETELVLAIDLGMGRVYYEFQGEDRSYHHHHIVCEKCGQIEHLEVCGLEAHAKMLETMGYKNIRHKLEFTGLCKACN